MNKKIIITLGPSTMRPSILRKLRKKLIFLELTYHTLVLRIYQNTQKLKEKYLQFV